VLYVRNGFSYTIIKLPVYYKNESSYTATTNIIHQAKNKATKRNDKNNKNVKIICAIST
jgi:hypothetical protein